MNAAVRVELPANLCRLASCDHVLQLAVAEPVTLRTVLDALEGRCPALVGCVRDHSTGLRRPFLRFFACEQDISHLPLDAPLPQAVGDRREVLLILGAIAGG